MVYLIKYNYTKHYSSEVLLESDSVVSELNFSCKASLASLNSCCLASTMPLNTRRVDSLKSDTLSPKISKIDFSGFSIMSPATVPATFPATAPVTTAGKLCGSLEFSYLELGA